MKRTIFLILLAATLAPLAGCVYDPGYSYVRGDGYYGDAYYGHGEVIYEDAGPAYYPAPYYDPWCCYYGPSVGIGLYYRDYGGHHHWRDGHRDSWHGGDHRGDWHGGHRGHWGGDHHGHR
ncbi:MAG TPA: hypothetical protein VF216_11045 [Mizugakiibacter sp.]